MNNLNPIPNHSGCSTHDYELEYYPDYDRCPGCQYDEEFWGYGSSEICKDGASHDYGLRKSHSPMNFYTCTKCDKEDIEFDMDGSDALHNIRWVG